MCAMREPLLVTRSQLIYVLLCVFDLALRFIWALSILVACPRAALACSSLSVRRDRPPHCLAHLPHRVGGHRQGHLPSGAYQGLQAAPLSEEPEDEDEDD